MNPMEGAPTPEQTPNNITSEELLAFARERPAHDSEVLTKLIEWLRKTEVSDTPEPLSLKILGTVVEQAQMKYRLGFTSAAEALDELAQVDEAFSPRSSTPESEQFRSRISTLAHKIQDGTFEVIHPARP